MVNFCLSCLQAAYVENLNGSQLFESMFAEDTDSRKINRLPIVEELLISYPLPVVHCFFKWSRLTKPAFWRKSIWPSAL